MNKALIVILATVAIDAIGAGLIFPILPELLAQLTQGGDIGFLYGAKTAQQRARWIFVALLLPFVAHSVSLAASSQAIGYRTLLPLTGLFLVLAAFGLRAIAARFGLPRVVHGGVLAVTVVVAAVLARHNALALIAEPQGNEWRLMEAAVERMRLSSETRVYLIRPSIQPSGRSGSAQPATTSSNALSTRISKCLQDWRSERETRIPSRGSTPRRAGDHQCIGSCRPGPGIGNMPER